MGSAVVREYGYAGGRLFGYAAMREDGWPKGRRAA